MSIKHSLKILISIFFYKFLTLVCLKKLAKHFTQNTVFETCRLLAHTNCHTKWLFVGSLVQKYFIMEKIRFTNVFIRRRAKVNQSCSNKLGASILVIHFFGVMLMYFLNDKQVLTKYHFERNSALYVAV